MKIYTKVVMNIDTFDVVEEESYEYDGPMALCAVGGVTGGLSPNPTAPPKKPNIIPIAWSKSGSQGSNQSGMNWNNPFIAGQLAALGTESANFQVPGGNSWENSAIP